MNRLIIIYSALILWVMAGTLSSCTKGQDTSCQANAVTAAAPAGEIADVQNYLSTNGITATQHSSGLFYSISGTATGGSPSQCSRVSVRYTGRLTSGTIFDQASTPVSFFLYELIAGWRIGLPMISSGQTIRLYIPPSLGYGNQQAGTVPPNSILIFDVELVSVSN